MTVQERFKAYVSGVLDGSILAGKAVQWAVKRHFEDLKRDDLHFNLEKALHAASFFERYLKHFKGEFAGKSFILSGFQVFIIFELFGWYRGDRRRFNVAYIQTARKAGKSMLAAGIALYLLLGDSEHGSEVYSVATKQQQAKIVHDAGRIMLRHSPDLKRFCTIRLNNISVARTNSKFEALGADAYTLDGLDIHGAIVDELHAHKTPEVWDVIVTATGARTNPLIFAITTAGVNREGSVCLDQCRYGLKILDGTIQDDSFFAFIAQLDEGDHWTDERAWAKANPNLGITPKLKPLQLQCQKAREVPAAEAAFRMKLLNEWVDAEMTWIPVDKWDLCKGEVDSERLKGRRCFGGLDLSTTEDLTAFMLLFPPEADGERFEVLPFFFVPEDRVQEKSRADRVPYRAWADQGFLFATPGNQVDYGAVKRCIEKAAEDYELVDLAYDRFNSTHLIQELQDSGLTVTPFSQGIGGMSAPSKELLRMVLSQDLRHDGNSVLRWNVGNVVVTIDDSENIKPSKKKSTDRIDGVVALIMAIGNYMKTEGPPKRSVYEDRGAIFL